MPHYPLSPDPFMTYDRFLEIQAEVVNAICNTLENVSQQSFSDFVLLLARGDYDYIIGQRKMDLSPYVIEDPTADYMDRTRLDFLTSYLNDYSYRLQRNEFSDEIAKEYEVSIQMMIYSHVWESHLFLKQLERIANILSGEGYIWKSCIKTTSKKNFLKHHIIDKLERLDNELFSLLKKSYSSQIRNDFAHSTYTLENGIIYSHSNGLYSGPNITFCKWEEKFVYSIMLSYHLIRIMQDIKNSFINDYGAKPILVERPLRNDKKKKQRFFISPMIVPAYSDGKHIRFNFVRRDVP